MLMHEMRIGRTSVSNLLKAQLATSRISIGLAALTALLFAVDPVVGQSYLSPARPLDGIEAFTIIVNELGTDAKALHITEPRLKSIIRQQLYLQNVGIWEQKDEDKLQDAVDEYDAKVVAWLKSDSAHRGGRGANGQPQNVRPNPEDKPVGPIRAEIHVDVDVVRHLGSDICYMSVVVEAKELAYIARHADQITSLSPHANEFLLENYTECYSRLLGVISDESFEISYSDLNETVIIWQKSESGIGPSTDVRRMAYEYVEVLIDRFVVDYFAQNN